MWLDEKGNFSDIVSELSRPARSRRQTHNICHDISMKKSELHDIKQNFVIKHGGDMTTKTYVNAFAMKAEIPEVLKSMETQHTSQRLKYSQKTTQAGTLTAPAPVILLMRLFCPFCYGMSSVGQQQ